MQVKEVMTRNVEFVSPDDSIQHAAEIMRQRDVGMLPVRQGQQIVGTITDRDISIRSDAEGRDPAHTRISDIMTKGCVTCYDDSEVSEAIDLIQQKEIRRLIVKNHQDMPVGVISVGDLAWDIGDDRLSGALLRAVTRGAGHH